MTYLFNLCTLAFCLHVYLCEGFGSSGMGVTDSCELPYGCWELNPGPLEEQPVLLTNEPSLQPQNQLLCMTALGEGLKQSYYRAQTGLKLGVILLPQPLKCWRGKVCATMPNLKYSFGYFPFSSPCFGLSGGRVATTRHRVPALQGRDHQGLEHK